MNIRKINTEFGKVPTWGDDDFDESVHANFVSLKEIVPQLNTSIDDINAVVDNLNGQFGTLDNSIKVVTQLKIDTLAAKDEATFAKGAAIAAKNLAETIYDNFDDRYLDSHAIAPTVDNDGNALRRGALYYNSTNSKMYVYDLLGAKWVDMMYIPTLLSSLSDIVFGSKANNDVIQYDSATGKWVNRSFYSKAELDAFIDIHSKTAKATLADTDEIMAANSATGFTLVKITWATIKSTLKTYFDSFYSNKVSTSTLNALVKFGDTVGTLKNGVGAYLTDNGNMLIGTTTDNGVDKLQVNGSITHKVSAFKYTNANNACVVSEQTVVDNVCLNIPYNDYGYLSVTVNNPNLYCMQTFTGLNIPARLFIRVMAGGNWSSWVEK